MLAKKYQPTIPFSEYEDPTELEAMVRAPPKKLKPFLVSKQAPEDLKAIEALYPEIEAEMTAQRAGEKPLAFNVRSAARQRYLYKKGQEETMKRAKAAEAERNRQRELERQQERTQYEKEAKELFESGEFLREEYPDRKERARFLRQEYESQEKPLRPGFFGEDEPGPEPPKPKPVNPFHKKKPSVVEQALPGSELVET